MAAPRWSKDLSFASPESDFVQSNYSKVGKYSSYTREQAEWIAATAEWSGVYSFASPESDFSSSSEHHLPAKNEEPVLPRTFAQALQMQDAAIVVTTPSNPHYIVHVNEAWEGLCGFEQCEALYEKLDIIQGPESNTNLAHNVVDRVLKTGKPQDAYLINYTKEGRRFTNHVTMGPLYLSDDQKDVEFLVGILQEVDPSQVPLRLAV